MVHGLETIKRLNTETNCCGGNCKEESYPPVVRLLIADGKVVDQDTGEVLDDSLVGASE